jgi:hypothetical protein
MLRLLVLLLVLANGAYFAWSQGLLLSYGWAPVPRTETQRLAQQVQAQNLQLLTADEAKRLESAPQVSAKPGECLQAGPFNEAEGAALRSKFEALLPAGGWALDATLEPARWIVYMGKFPSAEALAKKRAELALRNLKFDEVTNPTLEFGLSLGGYDSQAGADAALEALASRGVRTARVVQERAEVRALQLKISLADEAVKARLEELRPALSGKPLRACK